MKQPFFLLFIFMTMLQFSACQSDISAHLNGTNWEATNFSVTMPSYRSSDSSYVKKADKSNWESVLQGKPSKLHFNSDGSYSEEHFNLNNDLILTYQGAWEITGDSIIFNIQKPAKIKHTYLISLDDAKSTLQLSRTYDHDRDKQADDQQVVIYKKQ
ncbi:MAG: hypothetical protein R3E32_18560 [Chitinophagales bacterium]